MPTPTFGDLNKKASDLFKKKFDYDNVVKIKRTTASGLKVESTMKSTKGLVGSVKGTFKDKDFGEVEFQASTKDIFNGKLKLTTLLDGLTVTLKTQLGQKKPTDPEFTFNVCNKYVLDDLTATLDVNFGDYGDAIKPSAKVGAVYAIDGVSLGASVDIKKAGDDFKADINAAFEVAEADFTLGLATSKGPGLVGSIYQKVSSSHFRSIKFEFPSNTATFATQYGIDADTTVKASLSTAGVVQTALETVLANPAAKLNFATSYATTNGLDLSVQKYGVGVSLGDF